MVVTQSYNQVNPSNNNNNNNNNTAMTTTDGPLATQPIPPQEPHYQDQAQFESDKRAVYKHPLFPLLALLFEKCEIATQTAPESAMSDSFHHDLEAFVQHQERDRKPFLANDQEVDGLMIKAIQVLRIHLLELDKVQELCKDFCTRYITCLKGKMQSENLLRSDYYDTNSNGGGSMTGGMLASSHSNSPHNSCYSSNGEGSSSVSPSFHHAALPPYTSSNTALNNNNNNNTAPSSSSLIIPPSSSSGAASLLLPHSPSLGEDDSSNHHPGGGSSSSNSPTLMGGGGIHGGTPLSQIGANSSSVGVDLHHLSHSHHQPHPGSSTSSSSFLNCPNSPSSGDEEEDFLGRKKPKRGVLPKHATSIMRSWLFQHIVHPYPTEDEKRQIAAQTNLTLLQVNNWFINARRRILQPMLDASNPEPSAPKAKKMKTNGSKPALKYWSNTTTSVSGSSNSTSAQGGGGGGVGNISSHHHIPDRDDEGVSSEEEEMEEEEGESSNDEEKERRHHNPNENDNDDDLLMMDNSDSSSQQ